MNDVKLSEIRARDARVGIVDSPESYKDRRHLLALYDALATENARLERELTEVRAGRDARLAQIESVDANLASLRGELNRLTEGLRYINQRGYTGACFVAGEVLNGSTAYTLAALRPVAAGEEK